MVEFRLPSLFAINEVVNGNTVQQLHLSPSVIIGDKAGYALNNLRGSLLIPQDSTDNNDRILVVTKKPANDTKFLREILIPKSAPQADENDFSDCRWLRHPSLIEGVVSGEKRVNEVVASWCNGFSFLEEQTDEGGFVGGLREPQLGALHAIHAHWSVNSDTATIVMPTGTGKTETMLSVLVSKSCKKVLVVVPTDALRNQIATKFLTFGLLKDLGVISQSCLFPVVGILKHKPKNNVEVDELFTKCNVVVGTSHIVGQSSTEVQKRMAFHCSHLFIDEAHHVAATTWTRFKKQFSERKILQFTATPFREDDKPLEGKIIYKYPLNRAQEKGYFTKINFKPVKVFTRKKRDQAIAEMAIAQLKEDLINYKHILMARVNSIAKAKSVYRIYQEYPEYSPVILHSELTQREREEGKRKLLAGESQIVVCVDMLGEGFDLPQLKIAAFHDIKKSPTVTIQLAGRFTRSRPDLGEATFIANIGSEEVREELKKLYTREPDWNYLLPKLSEDLVDEQIDLNEFSDGFKNFPAEIPIQTLTPALSTVIYKTKCVDWTPENYINGLVGVDSYEKQFHDINHDSHTLIIVTAKKVRVDWTQVEDIYNWDWNLYVLFWDKDQNLLFVNNSNNNGEFKRLAKSVAGENAELMRGDALFRCLGRMTRITFKNVGLSEQGMISYTGRMGSDVKTALSRIQTEKATKSVLVGSGFEDGKRVSLGCSSKGRVWAHARSFQLNKFIEWCSDIGNKVLDGDIDPDQFLENTLGSAYICTRPDRVAFAVDWNEEIYKISEESIFFIFAEGKESQLYEVDLNILGEPSKSDPLRFAVISEHGTVEFTFNLTENDDVCDFEISSNENDLKVELRGNEVSARTFFYQFPPMFRFIDGSSLCGNKFTFPMEREEPFDKDRIQVWDWTDVDIEKESQGVTKRVDSVQFRVIQELKKKDFDVVFDDDSSGESADVVAIKVDDEKKVIQVDFYHLKFSGEAYAGYRIDDLYQLCGQAQKSIRWMIKPEELFLHLLRREEKRLDEGKPSRIEVGDSDVIEGILEKSYIYKTYISIYAVQPGLSKTKVSVDQLELLSVTDSFLRETYRIPFVLIGNA